MSASKLCVHFFWGEIDKIGYTRVVSEQIGYLFFRDGARLRTSAKRLQNAFWRLNPLRLVCAQHPKPFFRCSTPQNSANDGAKKGLSTNNPILFRNTTGIPCPVLRFYKPRFCSYRTTEDLSHNWQVAGCDDCDAAAAALLTSRPTKIRRD